MYSVTLLAVLASTLLTLGLYLLKRQAERLPSLGGGWRLSAWVAFFRDPLWVCGLLLQIVGYGLYFLALRVAPLSIVHTALNGGIVLFVILSVVGLREEPRPVEWLGVLLITGSLITLSASLSEAPAVSGAAHDLVLFSVAVLALSVLAGLADQQPDHAIGLSVASGLILGLASVYAKGLADDASLFSEAAAVDLALTVVANIVGFALMQAALQRGRGVVVMPIYSGLSNLVPILGGILVYGETLPSEGSAALLRPLAFTLALAGAALLAGFGGRAAPAAAIVQPEEARSR
jgi:uncharacterized membrane protein